MPVRAHRISCRQNICERIMKASSVQQVSCCAPLHSSNALAAAAAAAAVRAHKHSKEEEVKAALTEPLS
jgi:hypothetical protein